MDDTLEQRMKRMEDAYGAQSELMKELREAVTVTAYREARQGKVLKEHGEWLTSHDLAMKEHDAAIAVLDERLAKLVSEFGEFMRSRSFT